MGEKGGNVAIVAGVGGVTDTAQRARFSSFEESTEEDWAIISPQLNVTQSLVPERVMRCRALRTDHGGFPVSRLEHSLQTATRAERDGRDEEYVLCALLHDIGDTLSPFNHPSIAADILKPFVSRGQSLDGRASRDLPGLLLLALHRAGPQHPRDSSGTTSTSSTPRSSAPSTTRRPSTPTTGASLSSTSNPSSGPGWSPPSRRRDPLRRVCHDRPPRPGPLTSPMRRTPFERR